MRPMSQGTRILVGASEPVLDAGRSASIGFALLTLLLVIALNGCGLTTNSGAKQVPGSSLAALKVATPALPSAQMQGSYQASLSASGGKSPYTWSVASGALPAGLALTSATGTISGKPSQAGAFSFAVKVQDSSSPLQTASAPLTLNVSAASTSLQITTTSLASGQVQSAYQASLAASGGTAPYSWSVTAGAFPSGLSLSGSSGVISGVPAQSGSFPITVQVNDAASHTASASLTLQISAAAPPPSNNLQITTTSLPSAQVSQPFQATIAATGGTAPYTWGLTSSSGPLAGGLTLSATTGQISGTPSQTGQYSFTLQVTDSSSTPQSATKGYTLIVSNQPATDQYGGLLADHSPNGATGFWRTEKFGNRWMFVDPDGNAFWMMSVFAVDTSGSIVNGTSYSAVVQAKYGSSSTWAKQTILRLRSWGFNSLAPYASDYVQPFSQYPPGPASPSGQYMPTVLMMRPSWYGLTDSGNHAPGSFKNLEDCLDSTYTGYRADGPPDVYDPNFAAYTNGLLQSQTASGGIWNQAAASPWVIGVATDDADNLQGFGPGTDVPSTDGVVHVNIGWLAVAVSPTKTSSTKYGVSYSDPTVYTKKALHDFLVQKYNNSIAALNTAWGSNYTTFDSAGGWGSGTGLMDEDGRHTAWLGTTDGTLQNASAGVVADLNAFLGQYAQQYFSITAGAVRKYMPHSLVFGPDSLNSHGGVTRAPVLQAAGQYLDVLSGGAANQQVLDFTEKSFGDKPMVTWEGTYANPDSDLSGNPNPGVFGYTTQAARGQGYAARANFLFNTATSSGSYTVIGLNWWAWEDSWGEKTNWGLVTFIDNAYDGKEAVTALGTDVWGYPTGKELTNYGDFLGPVTNANQSINQTLANGLP